MITVSHMESSSRHDLVLEGHSGRFYDLRLSKFFVHGLVDALASRRYNLALEVGCIRDTAPGDLALSGWSTAFLVQMAECVVSVDSSVSAVRNCEAVLAFLELPSPTYVVGDAAASSVVDLLRGNQFDLIFLDGPNDARWSLRVFRRLRQHGCVSKDAILVVDDAEPPGRKFDMLRRELGSRAPVERYGPAVLVRHLEAL